MALFVKDPDAVLDYGIDWSEYLEDGEVISMSSWISNSTEITLSDPVFGETKTLVWISGGIAGKTYQIVNRIATTKNRTDDRTFYLQITNR